MFKVAAGGVISIGGLLLLAALTEGDSVYWIGAGICASIFIPLLIGVWWEENRKGSGVKDEVTTQSGMGNISITGDHNEFRDNTFLNIAPVPTAQPTLPDRWWLEENAPRFDPRASTVNGMGTGEPNRLAVTFEQEGAPVEAEARWLGDGLSGEWAELTRENPRTIRKYMIRGHTPFMPKEDHGTIKFQIRAHWRGAYCYTEWEWPFRLSPKYNYVNLVLDTSVENLKPAARWRVPD